jgi:hypothetical protein
MNINLKTPPVNQNIIDLRGIGQSYDGGATWIIKDLDLLIEDKLDRDNLLFSWVLQEVANQLCFDISPASNANCRTVKIKDNC